MIALLRRCGPFLIYLAAVAAVLVSVYLIHRIGYTSGARDMELQWAARWEEQAAALATAKAKAIEVAREEEQRRQADMEKVRQDAEKQIARAEADATAADAAAHGLREQAKRLAARASQCPGNTDAPQHSEAAPSPGMVLSDVLSRADERAGQLAAAYDRARASGLACERAYESLSSVRSDK
ncbi:DUF2514 domain-containing protein [Aeromonas sp.]|uniref:DUF2514 domain-containing protein n=1 Tax=Aeromonas sp. TaxID=647 RepID=UPI002582FC57|nr:DUF2514 domain-containing protein [Aeromonas sp.]MCX7132286.1 DUF2514 domain-containing protein [Aeromonas sp.]